MREWLTQAVLASATDIPEDLEGYILGRGLPGVLASEMRVGIWRPPSTPAPDPVFCKRNGEFGNYREGYMTVPMWSPRGQLTGVEFRTWGEEEKQVRDYRLPESKWIPVLMGLTPTTLQKIWDGGDVWLVEGVFDMALSHAIPEKDVVLGCGTARVSRNVLNFLVRFIGPGAVVHVAFDMDETGRRQITGFTDEASGKWVPGVPDRLNRVGVPSRDVSYQGGKDPGEIWERGGRMALQSAFNL